ncbi:MAG TPA: hypothetical protein VJ499_01780 [Flavisolibacter sp.]|nr:hypothetical protein [Flavisolibacter sp.]
MNKHKLPVLGLSLILLITSCKKNDVQHENTLGNSPVAAAMAASAKASDWKTLSSWASAKGDKFTTYTSKITDSSITSSVTSRGMVLAFVKDGSTINALPFQKKGTNDSYYYYQVSNGSISLSCDNYSGTANLSSEVFKYFVFTPEKLKDLESQGYTKIKLMQLAYEDVAALFTK